MSRLVRPFETLVRPAPSGSDGNHGSADRDRVTVQIVGERLTARCPSTGLYDTPPTLTARVEQRPGGLAVTGQLRESFTAAMWQPAFLGLAIFMVALFAFGVVTLVVGYAAGGVPPLVIGLLGSIAFLTLWRGARRRRPITFDTQVRALERAVGVALTSGTGRPDPSGSLPAAPERQVSASGFADTAQGVLFYLACLGCACVLLIGLQAVFIGLTASDVGYLAGGTVIALVFGGTYRIRSRRPRRTDATSAG